MIGLFAVVALGGCNGVRFSVDLLPPAPALQRSVVIDDGGSSWGASTAEIALVEVSGVIQNGRAQSLLTTTENPVSRFVETLEAIEHDPDVRAVVLMINSRGGTVTASELMYTELQRFMTESEKPVVVVMGDYCASGGYYLACGADEIIANRTTITGSIGVIMQTFDVSDGLAKLGVRANAIVSGPNKTIASPFHPMSDEQAAILHGIVGELYTRFRSLVTTHRPGLDAAVVDQITDGRVVTGVQALELGLVDGLGTVRDGFDAAKRRAGVERAQLIRYHREGLHAGSAYAESRDVPDIYVNVDLPFENDFGFYYLWDPRVW